MRRVRRGAFAAPALSAANDRLSDPRDRGLLTDLLYGTLRHLILLDHCLALRLPTPEKLPAEVRDALRIGAYELLVRGTARHAAVDQWVGVVKRRSRRLAGLVNAVLRRVEIPETLPEQVAVSLPDWLYARLAELLGSEAGAAARGMLSPEPLWLSAMDGAAAQRLADDGCEVRPGPLAGSLSVRCPIPLAATAAYRGGLVQPQNPASRLPVAALGTVAGERVLDLAAGNGIKSAQLAAAGASVTAVELDARKLGRARLNLERLGLEVEEVAADLRSPPPLPPAPKVLLDAPCSGTGTLRGNPEIKLRLRPADVEHLAELQGQLLDTAATLTAPGGVLVYSVCALTPAEGPRQASRFLERHPDFTPETFEAGVRSMAAGTGQVILPVDGLDGFFIFRARRAPL